MKSLFLANAPSLSPPKGLDPGLQTNIALDMFQYLLHLCLHTKIGKKIIATDLVIAKLFHDQIPKKVWDQVRSELKTPGSAVRLNRLNIILVSSAEVEVEIFLADRVKPLHELQPVLDSLCLLPSYK